jgi:hypothetical protein
MESNWEIGSEGMEPFDNVLVWSLSWTIGSRIRHWIVGHLDYHELHRSYSAVWRFCIVVLLTAETGSHQVRQNVASRFANSWILPKLRSKTQVPGPRVYLVGCSCSMHGDTQGVTDLPNCASSMKWGTHCYSARDVRVGCMCFAFRGFLSHVLARRLS